MASPPESESPLSLGKGMGQAFVSVHVCAHGRNKVYGEGQGAPTSLSKSGHSGPPVPRILPSGVSLPPWSPSGSHFLRPVVGSLTLVTRSSSTLHPGRAGSCREGKGVGGSVEGKW